MDGLHGVDSRKIPDHTPVRGAISMDRTLGWVVLMDGLRGVDNGKIDLLARN
jgi:hypothetical protein